MPRIVVAHQGAVAGELRAIPRQFIAHEGRRVRTLVGAGLEVDDPARAVVDEAAVDHAPLQHAVAQRAQVELAGGAGVAVVEQPATARIGQRVRQRLHHAFRGGAASRGRYAHAAQRRLQDRGQAGAARRAPVVDALAGNDLHPAVVEHADRPGGFAGPVEAQRLAAAAGGRCGQRQAGRPRHAGPVAQAP